jgi:hypothetical protein
MCYGYGARFYPDRKLARVYIANTNCADGRGTLYCVLTAGVDAETVEIFSGPKLDAVYRRDASGEWQEHHAGKPEIINDEAELLQLPPTYEAQEPADWLPFVPFERRAGTATANEREALKTGAINYINQYVDGRIAELEAARAKALQALTAKLEACK